MAKNVFKPTDIMYNSRKVFIEPPKIVAEEPVEEVQAVEEATAVGTEANIPVQISHLKASGPDNW